MRRYLSPYIGKCHVPDLALAQTVDQHRNSFAGMIRPDPGWVIAMIGGHNDQIAVSRKVQKSGKLDVKPF